MPVLHTKLKESKEYVKAYLLTINHVIYIFIFNLRAPLCSKLADRHCVNFKNISMVILL